MMETGYLLACVLIICLCVLRFCIAFWREEAHSIKWMVPIPIIGVLYVCFVLFLTWIDSL